MCEREGVYVSLKDGQFAFGSVMKRSCLPETRREREYMCV